MLEHFKFCKTREVMTPCRGTEEAAGIDFFIPTDLKEDIMTEKMKMTKSYPLIQYNLFGHVDKISLKPKQSILIPAGIHISLEKGYCLKFENKSGVAAKKHILIGSSIVDSDYSGEIHINLHNVGASDVEITAGEKVAQGIIYKIELPIFDEYKNPVELYAGRKSARGAGGFGSTDKK